MVVGARQGKNYSESIKKGALRFILKHLVEFTAGRKIPDINSGLRIFSRREAVPYFSYLGDAFSFTTSITLAYMMNGMFIKVHSDQLREANRKNKSSPFQGFAPDTAVHRGGDSLFQPAEDIPCLLRCHARPFCDLFCRRLIVRTLHRISAGCWLHPLVIPHVWDGTGFNPTKADNYVSAKTGRRGPANDDEVTVFAFYDDLRYRFRSHRYCLCAGFSKVGLACDAYRWRNRFGSGSPSARRQTETPRLERLEPFRNREVERKLLKRSPGCSAQASLWVGFSLSRSGHGPSEKKHAAWAHISDARSRGIQYRLGSSRSSLLRKRH